MHRGIGGGTGGQAQGEPNGKQQGANGLADGVNLSVRPGCGPTLAVLNARL
jgi:hypothetical protein